MAYGIKINDSSGNTQWDLTGILGRVVGITSVSYLAGQNGTKTVSVPGILSTDTAIISLSDNFITVVSISISGTNVVVNRSTTGNQQAVTYGIYILRL